MRVFISWSGEPSRSIAIALREWLPLVIQHTQPWMSEEDIGGGARWNDQLANELEQSDFGIICLTQSNQHADWILFEGGALAKRFDVARLVPLYIDLKPADVAMPLATFHGRSLSEEGMLRLVKDLNDASERPLPLQAIDQLFSRMWPDLDAEISAARTANPPATRQLHRRPEEMLAEVVEATRRIDRRLDTIELRQSGLPRLDELPRQDQSPRPYENAAFGEALRKALVAAGRTQSSLANELSVDPGQVSRWINSKAVPRLDTLRRIEELLEIDLSDAVRATRPNYELFVSSPIVGLSDGEIESNRLDVARVVDTANEVVDGVYWSGQEVARWSDLGAADLATETSLRVFAGCRAYLYLHFSEMIYPSGALVELGFALGRKLKTTMIIKRNLRTPYMFSGFQGVAAKLDFLPLVHIYEVDDIDDAVRLIKRDGRQFLGLS